MYNVLGQLTSETRTMGRTTSRVRYGYSPSAGNMNALVYPSGHILRLGYDPVLHLKDRLFFIQPRSTHNGRRKSTLCAFSALGLL